MKETLISAAQAAALFAVAVGAAVFAGILTGIVAACATVTWLECTKLMLRAIVK